MFFAVVFFELILLFIWLLFDPPESIVVMQDTLNLLAIHQCQLNYPAVWYALQFGYFLVVLAWGAYLAYETRDIWQKYNYPNESRSILLSIYNISFCGLVLIPLVTALNASTATLCFLVSVAIIFPTTFALICVHGPKLQTFLASSRGKSKGSNNRDRDTDKDARSHHDSSHTAKIKPSDVEKAPFLGDDPEVRPEEIKLSVVSMSPINPPSGKLERRELGFPAVEENEDELDNGGKESGDMSPPSGSTTLGGSLDTSL